MSVPLRKNGRMAAPDAWDGRLEEDTDYAERSSTMTVIACVRSAVGRALRAFADLLTGNYLRRIERSLERLEAELGAVRCGQLDDIKAEMRRTRRAAHCLREAAASAGREQSTQAPGEVRLSVHTQSVLHPCAGEPEVHRLYDAAGACFGRRVYHMHVDCAMDSISAGLPTMVYVDYPENYSDQYAEPMRKEFRDSGILASIPDIMQLRAHYPTESWVEHRFRGEELFEEMRGAIDAFRRGVPFAFEEEMPEQSVAKPERVQ